MMTAVSIVQHAAGQKAQMQGGGVFSFIKYDNRAISIVLSALLAAGAVSVATATPQPDAATLTPGGVPTF